MSRRLGLAAGLAVVALANGWALAAAARNRAGEPDALVVLSERELRVQVDPDNDEDTGLALALDWLPREARDEEPGWLAREKLAELGFDVHVAPDAPDAERFYRRALPRRAFVVLELGGESWRRWLARQERDVAEVREEVASGRKGREALEQAEEGLRWQRRLGSRLFAADFGRSAAALRRRYPDRARYLILEGVIHIYLWQQHDRPSAVRGSVARLAVKQIHVPLRLRPPLDDYLREHRAWSNSEQDDDPSNDDALPPRLRATIAVGRRHEPWLLDVRR